MLYSISSYDNCPLRSLGFEYRLHALDVLSVHRIAETPHIAFEVKNGALVSHLLDSNRRAGFIGRSGFVCGQECRAGRGQRRQDLANFGFAHVNSSLHLYLYFDTMYKRMAINRKFVNTHFDNVQMTPVQMKMARAALGWGVRELAEKAGVTANTVTRIENGSDAKQSTVAALRFALESAGVEFTNGDAPGVKLRKGPVGNPSASIPIEKLTSENDD